MRAAVYGTHHRKRHHMRHASVVNPSTGDLFLAIADSSGEVSLMTYSSRDQSSAFQSFSSAQEFTDTFTRLTQSLNSP